MSDEELPADEELQGYDNSQNFNIYFFQYVYLNRLSFKKRGL